MKHTPIVRLEPRQDANRLMQRAERELEFLHLRRKRLPSRRMSDAHWAILLDLYVSHAAERQVLTKELEITSGVSHSTLLRYLSALEDRGMIMRKSHEHDARATCIIPTSKGLERIASILREASLIERSGEIVWSPEISARPATSPGPIRATCKQVASKIKGTKAMKNENTKADKPARSTEIASVRESQKLSWVTPVLSELGPGSPKYEAARQALASTVKKH